MNKMICFDMDGTLADLYGYAFWEMLLRTESTRPYRCAEPLLNLSALARQLHRVQALGYKICIISWTAMNGSAKFNLETYHAKTQWLKQHLPSVEWDEIHIVPYGTPKHELESGILFDDNAEVRAQWGEGAYDATEILTVLKGIR